MRRFEGHTILVTGASSGIGLAAARRLASEGAQVICVARTKQPLDDAVASLPGQGHLPLAFDASSEGHVEAATTQLRSEGRVLHGAVLATGQHSLRPLQLLKAAHLDESISVNLRSALLCTKAVARLSAKDGASIVWVSSAAALIGNAGEAAYAASKGALISASRSLAAELAARRIRINVVAPGVVKTPMSERWLSQLIPEHREKVTSRHLLGLGCSEDVAAAIAFLASEDAKWVTGSCLVVDGGLTCH